MTGEMGSRDLQPGGEYHAWGEEIRLGAIELGRRTRWMCTLVDVRPFDKYQGPYARVVGTVVGQLWHQETWFLESNLGTLTATSIEDLAAQVRAEYHQRKIIDEVAKEVARRPNTNPLNI